MTLDARREAGAAPGPLFGLPVGVKDIFDTTNMPTENGTILHRGRRPSRDATMVARLRAAGVAEAAWIGACTYSDPQRFFSYRRATHAGEPDYGRLISAIRL